MRFEDDRIVIDKSPSSLDELVLDVIKVFDEVDVDYAVVSGYVAVLLGRSRATEDIDVITERFSEPTARKLSDRLRDAGYWGPAMPLDSMYEVLADGLNIRVAEVDHLVPSVELKFATDESDRVSLRNTVTVELNDRRLQVGSLEFQIAYKLEIGAEKDYEDALYLYRLVGSNLKTRDLERYVERPGVEDEYERLRRA